MDSLCSDTMKCNPPHINEAYEDFPNPSRFSQGIFLLSMRAFSMSMSYISTHMYDILSKQQGKRQQKSLLLKQAF
jgi:hypothetical protein